jgi:hypothetical protein
MVGKAPAREPTMVRRVPVSMSFSSLKFALVLMSSVVASARLALSPFVSPSHSSRDLAANRSL